MHFKEAAEFITAHRGPIAIGAAAFGVLTYQFVRDVLWPEIRPARPVQHSQEYLEATARMKESMRKLGLD